MRFFTFRKILKFVDRLSLQDLPRCFHTLSRKSDYTDRSQPFIASPETLLSYSIRNFQIRKPEQKKMNDKVLAVFDFDHTIINENSDSYIQKILPDKGEEVRKFRTAGNWIPYMQMVFEHLCKTGQKPKDIIKCLEEISLVPGMNELLTSLKKSGHEVVIISDCNTVFVDTILARHGLKDIFQKIVVNPSKFKQNGCLEIGMYHIQDTCELSAVNLCKGQVLEEYIEERKKQGQKFKFIAYAGDGSNDYCPILRLSSNDLAFPRKDFALHNIILKESGTRYKTKAQVVPWENAVEIKTAINEKLK